MTSICTAQQADIPAINALFEREYGNYPYALTALNNDHINLVAVNGQGEIIGFARAAPYGAYVHVWELCSLITHPEKRGNGVGAALTRRRLDMLSERGVDLVVSEPVACYRNLASQRNLVQNFGFKPVGLIPVRYPGIRREILGQQPLSLTIVIKSLTEAFPVGRTPLSLNGRVVEILNQLVGPRFCLGGMNEALQPKDSVGLEHDGVRGSTLRDIPAPWLNPLTLSALQRQGFRFCAILPGLGKDPTTGHSIDMFRFYKPGIDPSSIDWNLVHVIPELQALKDFCIRDQND